MCQALAGFARAVEFDHVDESVFLLLSLAFHAKLGREVELLKFGELETLTEDALEPWDAALGFAVSIVQGTEELDRVLGGYEGLKVRRAACSEAATHADACETCGRTEEFPNTGCDAWRSAS